MAIQQSIHSPELDVDAAAVVPGSDVLTLNGDRLGAVREVWFPGRPEWLR
jgi:hypothetical protein